MISRQRPIQLDIDTLPFRGITQTRSRNRHNRPMRSSYMENRYSLMGTSLGPNKFAVDEEMVINNNGKIQRKEKHRIMKSPYSRRVQFMNQPYPPILINKNIESPSLNTPVLDRMPTPFDNVIRFEKPKTRKNQSAKRKYKKRNVDKKNRRSRNRKQKNNEV